MPKKKNRQNLAGLMFFVGAIFIIGGIKFLSPYFMPRIIRGYVQAGLGDCQQSPHLCQVANQTLSLLPFNTLKEDKFIPYRLKEISIHLPRPFKAIEERFSKSYFKKHKPAVQPVAYLLYRPPNFFVEVFGQVKAKGINNNLAFIQRLWDTNLDAIDSADDAFFAIMRSIFTPNLGDVRGIKIAKLDAMDKKGFLLYNLQPDGNYFYFNVVDKEDRFFAGYIQDKIKTLSLEEVLAVIDSVRIKGNNLF